MGPTHSTTAADQTFPMHNYLNQGLSRGQVLMVRTVFDSYCPQAGSILAQKYRDSLLQAGMQELVSRRLATKETLNFDEFFGIEKEMLMSQLERNPQLEMDSSQVDPPTSLFCPYAQEVVRN